MELTYEQVRAAVVESLAGPLQRAGMDSNVADDVDVLGQGLVDSISFMDLLEELEDRLNIAIDLAELDDQHLTTIGGLSRQLLGCKRKSAS